MYLCWELLGRQKIGYPISFLILSKVFLNTESFPIFVGTALFSFEGICLILPIAESMKQPGKQFHTHFIEKFGGVLTLCVFCVGTLFTAVGIFGYLALGSRVSTIVFLDLPSTSPVVPMIQFTYCLAIILSFPLTIYPAIRITEDIIFGSSTGKSSNMVKWQKNVYRLIFVAFLGAVSHFGADNLDKVPAYKINLA